jgi:DNA-directed RNA polymerase specialized sigma subunit
MNEEIPTTEVLVGDMKVLDYLATKHRKKWQEHPLQEELEDIIATELTEKERELFYLRFGEGLAFREIARIQVSPHVYSSN